MKKVLTKAQRRKIANWIGIHDSDTFAPDINIADAHTLVEYLEQIDDPDVIHNLQIAMCVGTLSYIRYKEKAVLSIQPSEVK